MLRCFLTIRFKILTSKKILKLKCEEQIKGGFFRHKAKMTRLLKQTENEKFLMLFDFQFNESLVLRKASNLTNYKTSQDTIN